MKVNFGRAGGLVVTTRWHQFCVFPANVRFAATKHVLVLFGLGFSWSNLK